VRLASESSFRSLRMAIYARVDAGVPSRQSRFSFGTGSEFGRKCVGRFWAESLSESPVIATPARQPRSLLGVGRRFAMCVTLLLRRVNCDRCDVISSSSLRCMMLVSNYLRRSKLYGELSQQGHPKKPAFVLRSNRLLMLLGDHVTLRSWCACSRVSML
jgi:hypothetical protein